MIFHYITIFPLLQEGHSPFAPAPAILPKRRQVWYDIFTKRITNRNTEMGLVYDHHGNQPQNVRASGTAAGDLGEIRAGNAHIFIRGGDPAHPGVCSTRSLPDTLPGHGRTDTLPPCRLHGSGQGKSGNAVRRPGGSRARGLGDSWSAGESRHTVSAWWLSMSKTRRPWDFTGIWAFKSIEGPPATNRVAPIPSYI